MLLAQLMPLLPHPPATLIDAARCRHFAFSLPVAADAALMLPLLRLYYAYFARLC